MRKMVTWYVKGGVWNKLILKENTLKYTHKHMVSVNGKLFLRMSILINFDMVLVYVQKTFRKCEVGEAWLVNIKVKIRNSCDIE